MEISSYLRNAPLDQTQSPESINPLTLMSPPLADDLVSAYGPSQQTTDGSPTDGAREATNNRTPGYDEIEQMTQDRLEKMPEYLEQKQKWDAWHGIESDFALVDHFTGLLTDDGTVTLENLRALANDPFCPNPEAKAAAQRLLSDMSIWNELAKGDNKVGTHDVTEFVALMKNQLKVMRDETRASIKAELTPPPTSPQPGQAAGGPGGSASPPSSESQLTRPPTSTKAGMEGATENLAIAADYLQQQMMELAQKAAADPSQAGLYQQQIAMLQNQYQSITNMMNQLTQMISNLSKMWSDVAMNSIRNVK